MGNPLEPVILGPVRHDGLEVRIRPGRPADAAAWRRLRLRDEALISPFWETTGEAWEDRHTEAVWLRGLVERRDEARAGRGQHLVVEVDGRFAGEVALHGVDPQRHRGEGGVWTDRELAGRGVGTLATAMLLDHAVEVVGLRRLEAPISTDNVAAATAARRIGLVREATMARALSVGGRCRDHDLWVLHHREPPPALVARLLGSSAERSTAGPRPVMPVTPVGTDRVVPRSPRAALVLARQRAGRLRRAAAPVAVVAGGPVTLRDHDPHGCAARLHVDPLAATTDTVTATVHHALGADGLCRVWATCEVGEAPLRELYVAAGLRQEGVLRDALDARGRRGDHELWAATVDRHAA